MRGRILKNSAAPTPPGAPSWSGSAGHPLARDAATAAAGPSPTESSRVPFLEGLIQNGARSIYISTQEKLNRLFEDGLLGLEEWNKATLLNWSIHNPDDPHRCAHCKQRPADIQGTGGDYCARCVNEPGNGVTL